MWKNIKKCINGEAMSDIFKDIIPSLLQNKSSVVTEANEKDYVPYIVNKALSFHYDCILYANEMNKNPSVDKLLQFHFFLNSVRGYKRPFQKWIKKDTIENLEAIKEYYKYSNEKAKEVLSILSDEQITTIKKKLDKGGVNDKHKRPRGGET
jgi:hypothetical protein